MPESSRARKRVRSRSRDRPAPVERRGSRSRSRYRTRSPRINETDKARIAKFTDELDKALDSRAEFDRFSRREIAITAKLMYLYGIASLGELRNTKARNRSFFVDDLRNQRYEYRDMKMLLEVLTLSLYLHWI